MTTPEQNSLPGMTDGEDRRALPQEPGFDDLPPCEEGTTAESSLADLEALEERWVGPVAPLLSVLHDADALLSGMAFTTRGGTTITDRESKQLATLHEALSASLDEVVGHLEERRAAVVERPLVARQWSSSPLPTDGLEAYTVLVRDPSDPERRPRAPGGDKAPHRTIEKTDPSAWKPVIVDALTERPESTLNAIAVTILDKTADVIFETSFFRAFQELLADGAIEHTLEAPVLWRVCESATPDDPSESPSPNRYEEKQERRRERLEERAAKARERSDAAFAEGDRIGKQIPLGQPILVGHHSERGHRADLKRIDRNMQKSLDERRKAKELERRAEAVGKGGISTDDPAATTKLEEKLRALEARQERDKAVNAAWRKAGKPTPDNAEGWKQIAESLDLPEEEFSKLRLSAAKYWTMHPQPIPSYVLKNRNAEIRRIGRRLESLEELSELSHQEVDHGVCTVEESPDENRLRIFFPEKPSAEVRTFLKSHGFRWARSEGAWQRQLSNQARYWAAELVKKLQGGDSEED